MKLESTRRCPDGELYRFKNGVARVPGLWIGRRPVTITIKEFNEWTSQTADVIRSDDDESDAK